MTRDVGSIERGHHRGDEARRTHAGHQASEKPTRVQTKFEFLIKLVCWSLPPSRADVRLLTLWSCNQAIRLNGLKLDPNQTFPQLVPIFLCSRRRDVFIPPLALIYASAMCTRVCGRARSVDEANQCC